jgi:hypothetical protein
VVTGEDVERAVKAAGNRKMTRIRCNSCGKPISSLIPSDTVLRGWAECPECVEAQPPIIITDTEKYRLMLMECRKGRNFRIEWDKNYGVDKRTGWSISFNGSFLVELEKRLSVAIIKAGYRKISYLIDNWMTKRG